MSAFRGCQRGWRRRSLSALALIGAGIVWPLSAEPLAGYAPGARSTTSANTMLDSVVGTLRSPIRQEANGSGLRYQVSNNGTVTAPDGTIVAPGCSGALIRSLPTAPLSSSPARSSRTHSFRTHSSGNKQGKGFETVMIGVTDQPVPLIQVVKTPHGLKQKADPVLAPRATLNASFGPAGLYVIIPPCRPATQSGTQPVNQIVTTPPSPHTPDRAPSATHLLTAEAAGSLAAANGNAFALAGNSSQRREANTAQTLPNGDVLLTISPARSNASQNTP